MFGKKCFLLFIGFVSFFAFNSCDAFSKDAGTFAVKFSWAKDTDGNSVKPDIESGEFFVTVRIYEWKEGAPFPGDIAANGKQLVQSDSAQMKATGTKIDFGDLTYGNSRFVVAEIRKGEELTNSVLFTGMSQLFDFKVGKHTEVNVEMSMTPTPGVDEEGNRIDAELRIVDDNGNLKSYTSGTDLKVKLRLLNAVSFTHIYIANKEENLKTANGKLHKIGELKEIEDVENGYELDSEWDLSLGLTADEIAVSPELKVYARLENEYGTGILVMAKIALDNDLPELTLGINPAYTNGSKPVTLNISANELIKHDSLNIQTTNDKLVFDCPTPTKNESLSFSCTVETLDATLKDGDYEITVTASDQAGNKSEEGKTTLAIDRESPELTFIAYKNGTEVEDTIYLKENDEFKIELILTKEPAETPVVRLGSAGINCEKAAALKYTCATEINKETYTEGISDLSVNYQDMAENPFSKIVISGIILDYTAPGLVADPLMRLNKPEECPLKNVSRATNGSSVEISFTVSEELAQIPVVKAYFEDAEIIFELSNQMGNFFSFGKDMDFELTEGSYGLEIGLTDIVGNSRKIITEDSFEIKTANPQSPFVETEKIVYRRIPYGSSETGGEMSFRVKTEGENVVGEDVSFLVAYNSDDIENALEIGSAQAKEGKFDEFVLNRSDRTEVFLVAYDNACNRSNAVKVKNVEWTVSMGRKDQPGVNPHKFMSTPDFYETLTQDVRAFEPEDIQKLSMLNGFATEKKSFGRWDVLDQGYGEAFTIEGEKMIYDSNRGMVVIFSENGKVFEYDTRTNLFNKRNVASLPPLSQGAMVYSPLNGKVLFFSYGYENGYVEVWELDFEKGVWEPKTVAGQNPGQGLHSIAYDSDRGKVILYGTSFSYSGFDPTVWEWDVENSSWEGRYPVVGESPFAWYFAAAYDSNRKKFVIFGGLYLTEEDIIWEWDTESGIWENRTLPGAKPEKRVGHSMIFDESRNKLMMIGGTGFIIEGYQVVFSDTFDDSWEWDPDTGEWEEQVCGEQCQRTMHSTAYDPLRNKAVVFGGFSDASEEHEVYNDLWELDIESGTWSEKKVSFLKPDIEKYSEYGERLIATAYDSDRDTVIVFATQSNKIEMWEWNNKSRDWKHRPTEGVSPDYSTSYDMKMVYDPDRKKCVLFGFYNNIWEWDIETGEWSERVTGEPKPEPRYSFSMVYDPVRKKTIVYGGYNTYFMNDLWEWDGENGTWIERTEGGIKPQARGYASMVYDADRNKVMLVGGFDWDNSTGSGIWIPLPELWEWNPETGLWTQKANGGLEPIGLSIYDSIRKKTVIYKGSDVGFIEWDGETETWEEKTFEGDSPGNMLFDDPAFFDANRGKIILYDGNIWEYDFGFDSRPAHIMQTIFSDSEAESSVEITSIAAKFYSGGTGQLDENEKNGAELKIWKNGRWKKLTENTVSPEALSNNPENGLLEWVSNDSSQLKTFLYGSSKTLNFAVTPIAPSGENEGVVATDYAEVVVRYRIE